MCVTLEQNTIYFRRREPANPFLQKVLAEPESDEGLPRPGGMDDGGFAGFPEHIEGGEIGALVVQI